MVSLNFLSEVFLYSALTSPYIPITKETRNKQINKKDKQRPKKVKGPKNLGNYYHIKEFHFQFPCEST